MGSLILLTHIHKRDFDARMYNNLYSTVGGLLAIIVTPRTLRLISTSFVNYRVSILSP
jgi:hypothetical protein